MKFSLLKASGWSWKRHSRKAALVLAVLVLAIIAAYSWKPRDAPEAIEPIASQKGVIRPAQSEPSEVPQSGAIAQDITATDQAFVPPLPIRPRGDAALPVSEADSLWAAFAKARHEVRPLTESEAKLSQNKGVRYFAANPGQELTARFLDQGVRIESGRGGSWQGTVQVTRLSRADQEIGLPSAVPSAKGERVEYPRGDVVEWYENRQEGFEQGFTVMKNPVAPKDDGSEASPLRIDVQFAGLKADPQPGGKAVEFQTAEGMPVLSYSNLKVWDARGTVLNAEMKASGDQVSILVADAGALYPLTIDPLIATLEQRLGPEVTGTGAAGDHFGASVAVDSETAIVGMPLDDTPAGVDAGSAYVFVRTASLWALQAKLTASNATANSLFGASVSLSGSTAVVGMRPMMSHPASSGPHVQSEVHTSSAYVYVRSGNTWTQQTILTSGAEFAVSFGNAVAVSGDTAVVGDPGAEKVHVFLRNGSSWTSQQVLTAPNGNTGTGFGSAVALSGDTTLIGAPFASGALQGASVQSLPPGFLSGAAYVFVRTGVNWALQAEFFGQNVADFLGSSVALSGDTALVGAPGVDTAAGIDAGLAYLYTRTGTEWSLPEHLAAADATAGAGFGVSVAVITGRALVGAPHVNSAYIFEPATTGSLGVSSISSFWEQMARLKAGDATGSDKFAVCVALSGETALIGTPDDDTGAGADAGAAFVFVRSDVGCCEPADPNNRASWCQQARLSPGDAGVRDCFGVSVAIQGNTALVGAQGDDSPAGADTGAVYAFVRNGTVWSSEARLTATDGSSFDAMGTSVALSGDSFLAGAPGDDTAAGQDAGSVCAFSRRGGRWVHLARLVATDGAESDGFGASVAFQGIAALIGSPGDDTVAGESAGSAYVFGGGGATWHQQAKLTASDAAAFDLFGKSVSLAGGTALIGAMGDDISETVDAGSAYVFVGSDYVWTQQARLTATPFAMQDLFGRSVALSGDTALVGAELADTPAGSNTGAAFVFKRTGTVWSQEARLTAGDGADGDAFGRSVALEGQTALATALRDDNAGGTDAGGTYVFSRSGSSWNQELKLTASLAAPADFFGSSVAISGNTVLVGAEGDDGVDTLGDLAVDQGSVHVFRLWTDSGSDIVVEHPLDLPLVDEQAAINFGAVVAGGRVEKIIYIRNTGAQNLTGIKVTIDGINRTDFKLAEAPPGTLAPLGLVSFVVSFEPPAVGSRNAMLHIASNDPDESPFDIQLFGSGYEASLPEMVLDPVSQLVPLGSRVRFTASAVGQPSPKVQWKRNGSNISGATSPTLSFTALLSSAGVYQMTATNSKGADTSASAELGVVDTSIKTLILPAGSKAVMTVITAGNGLSYIWLKDGEPFPPAGIASGSVSGSASVSANGKTLTITNLIDTDAGTYACQVTGPGGVLVGGTHHLFVIDGHPEIIEPIQMPSGMVGVPYTFTVPINEDPSLAPASFGASGLAPGLSINTTTGVVSGIPTSASPTGFYNVVFTATNIKGKYTADPTPLCINPLPCGMAGVFNGLVDRRGSLNGGFGGTIAVVVQPSGSFTGLLVFGPDRLPFGGRLNLQTEHLPGALGGSLSAPNTATATVGVGRAAPLPPLTLQFQINPNQGELFGTLVDPLCRPDTISDFVGLAAVPGSADGTGTEARFNGVSGIVMDKANNIYAADTYNHVIRKITTTGVVTTFAGLAGFCGSTDGLGPEALFHSPEGLAVDLAGNVYVADTGNRTIRKITPYGEVTTVAGSGGLSGSANGVGPTARFVCPTGLAVDAAGNIYVTDLADHTIRKITPAGVVTTFAGKSGTPGSANGGGGAARFNKPAGIAMDYQGGVLLVADSGNHVIREITTTGAVSTFAGAFGVPGNSDGIYENARFNGPRGIAVDAFRDILVADTQNHTVRRLRHGIVHTVAGSAGEPGSQNGVGDAARFNEPIGIAIQWGGRHFITERCSNAIRAGLFMHGNCPIPVLARRNPWGTDAIPNPASVKSTLGSASHCLNPPATLLAGTYNVALELPESLAGNPAYPQGNGFGTLTIKNNGTVSWTGFMADGAVTTCSTALGGSPFFNGTNYIPLHFMLYGNTGSAQGWQEIMIAPHGTVTSLPNSLPSETLIDGELDWMKIPQASASVRSYAAGIPLHLQTTLGEKNMPPPPGNVVLGFSPTSNNARISFYEGGLNPEFSQVFTITTSNSVIMPPGNNPKEVKMTTFSAANSKFAGNFTLKDPNPISGGTPAELSRKPTFNGVLLRRLGRGVGYFLLGELPSAGPPATTLTTSPIQSGQVILERAQSQNN